MNDQEITVRARVEDPSTSHLAAAQLEAQQDKLGHSVNVVVQILRAYGVCTDFQIASHWSEFYTRGKFSDNLPRMARLWAERRGKVVQHGYGTHMNRKCRTWKLAE